MGDPQRWEKHEVAYVRADGYVVSRAFVAGERNWLPREPLSIEPLTATEAQRRMAEEAILEWVDDHMELEHVEEGGVHHLILDSRLDECL